MKKKRLNISELWKEPIEAICAKCLGEALIYPGGLFCKNCSHWWVEDFLKKYLKTNGGYQKIPDED